MVQKIEIVLVLVAIILLTLFSASFAGPTANASSFDQQSAFYGRNILKESSDLSSFSDDSPSDYDFYFWGVPDFSHQ
ncbi:hypothetical protein [Fusibacter ferrireducens]|uniref:Uncharacterized protein n=1 Tax=Fusibacter ferrireducens TaxID=2785058 RepID=A0ABR9ZR22_9FIRM|nr:hypothetical protein [Fusibacter ferrireducens]MBF4692905.1 hypothetical protein [Fusibacter ferrireducens]